MEELIYRDEDHTYWLGDKQLPCVSNIVKSLSKDYSKIPIDTLNRKKNLGKAFHYAIHLFLMNDLDFDSLDEDLIEPMRGFQEFWSNDEFKNKSTSELLFINENMDIEKPSYHKKLLYAGTPDLIIPTTVYDWKLRKFDPIADPLRMAGYEYLAGEPKNKVVVCFDKDGYYSQYEKELENPNAWGVFRKCLEKYNSDIGFNLLCEKWRKSV